MGMFFSEKKLVYVDIFTITRKFQCEVIIIVGVEFNHVTVHPSYFTIHKKNIIQFAWENSHGNKFNFQPINWTIISQLILTA